MQIRRMILTAAALMALAAGCAKSGGPVVDLAAEEQAIRDRSAEWLKLAVAEDVAGIVGGVYLPDAETLFDGEARNGTAEIQAGMEKEMAAHPDSTISWTTTAVHVDPAGTMAWESGTWTFDADGAGEGAAVSGGFVTVWSKVDGTWRVAADTGSSPRPEPAHTEAAPATTS